MGGKIKSAMSEDDLQPCKRVDRAQLFPNFRKSLAASALVMEDRTKPIDVSGLATAKAQRPSKGVRLADDGLKACLPFDHPRGFACHSGQASAPKLHVHITKKPRPT